MRKRKALRAGLLVLWVAACAAGIYAWRQSGVPLTGLPQALRDFVASAGPWGPILFCLLFTARAATLLPASPFVLAAGLIWGPWQGVLWSWVGINLSGWAAYALSRWVGRDWVASHETPWMHKAEARLRKDPFMASLILRLIGLPFDPVNFACGLIGIPFGAYAASTAVGVLPGVVTFSLFGGSLADPRALAASAALLLATLALAAALKKRHG